jgi:hypothetical protein
LHFHARLLLLFAVMPPNAFRASDFEVHPQYALPLSAEPLDSSVAWLCGSEISDNS